MSSNYDGVLLFSNVQGFTLAIHALEPVFTELERRAATVFVHPNPSPDPVAHRLGLPDSLIDFTADTTARRSRRCSTATVSLARRTSSTSSRTQAGTIPLLGRPGLASLTKCASSPERTSDALPRRRSAGLYWDTALAFGDPVLRMLRSVVGLRHSHVRLRLSVLSGVIWLLAASLP